MYTIQDVTFWRKNYDMKNILQTTCRTFFLNWPALTTSQTRQKVLLTRIVDVKPAIKYKFWKLAQYSICLNLFLLNIFKCLIVFRYLYLQFCLLTSHFSPTFSDIENILMRIHFNTSRKNTERSFFVPESCIIVYHQV